MPVQTDADGERGIGADLDEGGPEVGVVDVEIVVLHERDQPLRRLKPGDIAVEIEPVHAFKVECDMLLEHEEYIRYLTFSQASCDETIDHLENLFETGSLTDEALYNELHARLDTLGRKINAFIQAVEKNHKA